MRFQNYSAVIAVALVAAAPAASLAFMSNEAPVTIESDSEQWIRTIEQLRAESESGSVNWETLREKIDAAIEAVDAKLDAGVADETMYLSMRDELVGIRLAIPTDATELTQAAGGSSTDQGLALPGGPDLGSDPALGGGGALGGGIDNVGGQMISGDNGGMGGAAGSSGGMGGMGGLGLAAALGISIPLAVTSDDDDLPGMTPSPSSLSD